MTVTQAKQRVLWLGIVLAISLVIGVIISLSQILSSFQEGADPASIFRGNQLVMPEFNQAHWIEGSLTRSPSPTVAEQEEIVSAYWLAWQALQRVSDTKDYSDLSTYFALPALATLQGSTAIMRDMNATAHQLQLRFFSEDHSVVSFRDDYVTIIMVANQQVKIPSTAEITMTNDSGRWRIRLMTITYQTPPT